MISKKLFEKAIAGISAICLALMCSCGSGGENGGNAQQRYDPDVQQIYIGEDIAVVPTSYGRVRGFIIRGVYAFKGIPYGASTAGSNRFMPPQKPEPWSDVRPAVAYGSSAPQDLYDRSPESYGMFVDHWNYDMVDEDCLRLNVWSPGVNDGVKRPVLVWLHGGGFAHGNGIEHDSYDGENFARAADVVYVSINHRLNAFGFSDLSKLGGEKYKNSGNAGMLDIVASLEWVRDNIANFGGDPGNVTVMGQSGGGSKVCAIAAMPAAKGLVHKGVALSGSMTAANDKQYAENLGEFIVREAGLTAATIDRLQQMPWEEYFEIANRAAAKFREQPAGAGRGGFSPVADGFNIPEGTFFTDNNPLTPNIPMLFCSTFNEQPINRDNPELENITLDGVKEALAPTYGDKSGSIVDAYARQFPELRPIEVYSFIRSNRLRAVSSANVKLQQGSPVYMAWFGMGSPLFDGRHRAFHCVDISYWLLNTDLMITHSGGGKRPRELSQKMAQSLASFMRTGDPNCGALPEWPKYTDTNGETMVLNEQCEVLNDPDRDARLTLQQ